MTRWADTPLRLVAGAALLLACGATPRPPLAAPTPTPRVSATPAPPGDAWAARLDAESAIAVFPGVSGVHPDETAREAAARLATLPDAERAPVALALRRWLLVRGWTTAHAREIEQPVEATLGDALYDPLAAACDQEEPPHGVWSMILSLSPAGHDALVERLLARAQAACDATTTGPRVRNLFQAMIRLDRPAPVHRALLSIAADARVSPEARREALTAMNRTDLPEVAPALRALARSPGDRTVREAATSLLAAMAEPATLPQLAALWRATPDGAEGVTMRATIGGAFVRVAHADAVPSLVAWLGAGASPRAGDDEADAWAHALSHDEAVVRALWRDRSPQGRALAALAWSWISDDALTPRVAALRNDHRALPGSSWRAHDLPTVAAVATWAMEHPRRTPPWELGCCH